MKASDKQRYAIATIKPWNIKKAKEFISEHKKVKILLITRKKELNYQRLKTFDPRYIFFPHWSWVIPEKIYKNFECVVFHMTDLPFGRGGSPLQNLIERGVYKTKISAIRVADGIDEGDIYLKRSMNLNGPAAQIFKRFTGIVFGKMMPYIVKNRPVPCPQNGKIVKFRRRTPAQGNIADLKNLRKVYDYIRMLDAESYPPAFLETPAIKVEFSGARLLKQRVSAQAKIFLKETMT
jgi:methionyl-tRNA formyltransferase